MFKKGERVLMKNCVGALREPNKIWECESDEYKTEYKSNVIKLKGCNSLDFPVEMLEKYRAVYKLNDYEWYVTSWYLEDTVEWYNKESEDEICADDIEMCNLDNEGMWIETTDNDDIVKLGDSDELISTKVDKFGTRFSVPKFGDLMRGHDGLIFKFTSYREVIEKYYMDNPLIEPEVIACTEW